MEKVKIRGCTRTILDYKAVEETELAIRSMSVVINIARELVRPDPQSPTPIVKPEPNSPEFKIWFVEFSVWYDAVWLPHLKRRTAMMDELRQILGSK